MDGGNKREEKNLDGVEETEGMDEVNVATGWRLWAEGIVDGTGGAIVGEYSRDSLADVEKALEVGGARGVLNVLVKDGFEDGGKYESMELESKKYCFKSKYCIV